MSMTAPNCISPASWSKPSKASRASRYAPTRIGTRVLASLGATPIQMPTPRVPESIVKGVADGASIPSEVVPAL